METNSGGLEQFDKSINHPYMEKLQGTLAQHKKLLSHLELRMVLIGQNSANLSEYDINENEIIKIKTEGEIDILKRTITEKEGYFKKFMQQFVIDLDDMEKNYDTILQKAKDSKKDAIRDVLYKVKWDVLENNTEVKLHFYKRLKKLIG